MNCATMFDCCRRSNICPKSKIRKTVNSPEQPWKRFTCDCPDGYHSHNCDQPIRSCQSYANGSRRSGMYKIVGQDNAVYDVYCHFDSDMIWTLVQSYSFANASDGSSFQRPLYENRPVSENSLSWSGYRLSKPRMKSIKDKSAFLLFTCDYEKHFDMRKSDYVQIPFQDVKKDSTIVDVIELSGSSGFLSVGEERGKIGADDLSWCQVWLYQFENWSLTMLYSRNIQTGNCNVSHLNATSCWNNLCYLFTGNRFYSSHVKQLHRCVQNDNCTTQLWFGSSS